MFDLASKFKNSLAASLICLPLFACATSGAEDEQVPVGNTQDVGGRVGSPPSAKIQEIQENKKEDMCSSDLTLASTEMKYAQASAIRMSVRKVLTLKLLDQKKEYQGRMILKRPGRLLLEFAKPERSVAAINPKSFVLIQYPVDDFDSTVRVTRSQDMKRIQSQHMMAVLMGRGSILKEFRVERETKGKGFVEYGLRPKKKNHDVRELGVRIARLEGQVVIEALSFVDQLENKTELFFEKIEFNVEVQNKVFQPEIPKGAEVTEI